MDNGVGVKTDKEVYDLWHLQRAKEESSPEIIQPWHRTVARLLPDINRAKLLEIGCGRGDFALWLARKYPRATITGIDFSDTAITAALAKLPGSGLSVSFVVEDAENLRLPSESFDQVISCECIEHVPRPEAMAREIARVLKPGGNFILTTENYFNGMLLAWLVSWHRRHPFKSGSGTQPRENFFLWWRVKRILEGGGLRVEHIESNHFQWLLFPGVNPRRLCTNDFEGGLWKRLFLPFGRHFTFQGSRV